MSDIFDEVTSPKKDIFDEIAPTSKDILKDNHSIGSYALETMQNVPRSAANLIGGSAKTVGKVASTGYNLLTDPYKELSETGPIDAKQGLYNTFNYFKDRYSHPLDTLREDPVGVAADVSTLASGAGMGARMLRMAPEASTALRGVGALTDPLRSGSTLAGAVTRVPRQAAAEGLYGKSLGRIPRDPKGLPLMEKSDLVKEGLNSQIPMSEKGAYLANTKISELSNQVDDLVKQIESRGGKVDMNNVLPHLSRSYEEFAHVAPKDDWAAIDAVRDDFLHKYGQPVQQGGNLPGDIPPTLANEVKRRTYQNVGNNAYTSKQSSATVEAMTDLARGLKKEIERLDASPQYGSGQIHQLNERQGNLIDLRKIAGNTSEPDLGSAAASQGAGYHWGLLRQLSRGVPYAESQAALSLAPGPPIAGPVRSVARAIGRNLTPAGTVGKAMSYSTKDPYQIEVVK